MAGFAAASAASVCAIRCCLVGERDFEAADRRLGLLDLRGLHLAIEIEPPQVHEQRPLLR